METRGRKQWNIKMVKRVHKLRPDQAQGLLLLKRGTKVLQQKYAIVAEFYKRLKGLFVSS